MVEQLWHIPISYAVVQSPPHSWSGQPRTWLKSRFSIVDDQINDTQALYVNVDAIGEFKSRYSN